jgi:hypothetical protein
MGGPRRLAGTSALAARIAIKSGPVVVDAWGEIFGDVTNIAARAQTIAEPGSVVVTALPKLWRPGIEIFEELYARTPLLCTRRTTQIRSFSHLERVESPGYYPLSDTTGKEENEQTNEGRPLGPLARFRRRGLPGTGHWDRKNRHHAS